MKPSMVFALSSSILRPRSQTQRIAPDLVMIRYSNSKLSPGFVWSTAPANLDVSPLNNDP